MDDVTGVRVIELEACASTQDEVLARLAEVGAGGVVAVRTSSQEQGRGREQRAWQDPPGQALLLSVGRRGPLPVDVLAGLPRRVVDAMLDAIEAAAPGSTAGRVHWKSPNDLVDANGAKLGGVLVDARTTGEAVDHVIVGIGCNVGGEPFATHDGRDATSLASVLGVELDLRQLARDVTARIAAELDA